MKITTSPIYVIFCLWPGCLFSQQQADDTTSVRASNLTERSTLITRESLQREKEKAMIWSYELINVRVQIAEWQAQESLHSETYLKELKEKESALAAQWRNQRDYVHLLSDIYYWPVEQQSAAIREWKGDKEIQQKEIIASNKYESPPAESVPLNTTPSPQNDHENGCGLLILEEGKDKEVYTLPELLFSYTNPELEEHFPKRDFINGYASLGQLPHGLKVLDLTISVATPKSPAIFGLINYREIVVLTLLDGTEIRLRNMLPSHGEWDVQTQTYQYVTRFPIGIKEERLLKKTELDKILLRWSKAEDQYEIFELDFFINHFRCLESD